MTPLARRPRRHQPFVLSLLTLAAIEVMAQDAASPPPAVAAAATDSAPAPSSQTIVITGRALSLRKALQEKRAERVISDGVSSDEIGAIPDFGLGEALERVPGVSMIVNNGRGESQFMTTRGFNPDYNAVTIDGIALPGTETTRRVVSLDVIPSSLAKQVSVYKTYTAEMDGNAIGGLTNLRTRSALDRVGPQATVRGDLSEWTAHPRLQGRSPSGQVEATVSNTFGPQNRFGALLSAGYFRRVSSSLNTDIASYSYFAKTGTQTIGAKLNPATTDVGTATALADRLRWLSYDNVRERNSLFTKLDYDNGDNFRSHLTGGYFQHLNDEHRHAQWLQNTTTASSSVTVNNGGGSAASGQAQADYAKFNQNRQLRFAEAGAEYRATPDTVLDLALNQARGSYRQDALLYTFAQANSAGLAYDYTQAPGDVPVMVPRNTAQLYDASRYTLSGTNGTQVERATTDQTTVNLNAAHNLDDGAQGWGAKLGWQQRQLDKTYNYDEALFNPATGQTTTLAQTGVNPLGYVPYTSLAGLPMLMLDQNAATAYVAANPGKFSPATAGNTTNSTQRDFRVQERVQAAYVMGAWQSKALTATAGVRVERTRTDIDTFIPAPLNQAATFAAYQASSSRTDSLPSLNIRWDAAPQWRLRAAASTTLARAQYAQLAQNSNSVSGTTLNTTLANPGLLPRQSRNLDLSAEWTISPQQALSMALFDKRIANEIANTTDTSTVVIGGQTFTQNTTRASNVGAAQVSGLELAYTHLRFASLPAPFNGLGVSVNATWMRQDAASIRMSDGRLRQMQGLQDSPKQLANLSLLWSQGPWSTQLAYKRTGRTMITASSSSAVQDVFVDAVGMVDAQLKFQVSKQIAVLLQGKNLTNAAQQRRLTGPGATLLNQEISNGQSYWLGATWSY